MARRFTSSAVSVGAASVLLAAGIASTATAQPGTVRHAATTHVMTAQTQQAVQYVGSTSGLPASHKHSTSGAVNFTEDGQLQRYANRSDSARPAVTKKNGARTMTSGADSWLPIVSGTATSNSRPNQTAQWEGLNEHDNGVYAGFSLEPPDQGLCAGNGHVLELINDVVDVYKTNGTPEHSPVYLNDFFNEPGYQFTTDPSCVYDKGSNHFFATQLTLDTDPNTGDLTGNNWLDLAVSKTGNPLGGYYLYRIYTTDDGSNGTPSDVDCPCIGDYPHIGTDTNGVYLTTNEYPFFSGNGAYGNEFNGAQLYAMSKRAVANGNHSVTVLHFNHLQIPTTSGPRRVGFTLWPAQSAGSSYDRSQGNTMTFTSSEAAEEARPDDFTGHANTIAVWSMHNTYRLRNGSNNVTLSVTELPVGAYGIPPLANQKAGPVPLKDCLNVGCVDGLNDQYAPEEEGGLDSSDTRMLTGQYANGQVISALDTAMQVGGNVQSGFEWFAVNVSGATPTLAKSGYVGVNGNNVIMPAIATDPSGVGYIGTTLSGNNYYPSAAYQTFNGTPGSTLYVGGVGAAPQDGFCEYLYFNCAGTDTPQIRPRWGDYGYAAWDGSKFFVANEYIAHSCSFATFDSDHSCGGTRTFYGNFSTHIEALSHP